MKRALLVVTIFLSLFLVFCNPARRAAQEIPPPPPRNVSYMKDVQPIIVTKCTPCHIPPKGNKKPYDTYVRVRDDIDSIISRINRNPGERGFMPFKHPKLSDSLIRVFEDWRYAGTPE